MVFYPKGFTWETAEIAMYTRPSTLNKSRRRAIRAQVDDVLAMYRRESERLSARRLGTIKSGSGSVGELWAYSGYSSGAREFAAYFVAAKTVNYFVVQVPKGADSEAAKQKLLELARSYREGDDCRPCAETQGCLPPN